MENTDEAGGVEAQLAECLEEPRKDCVKRCLQNSGRGVGGSVIQGHPQLQQVPGQPRLQDTLTKNSIQARMFYLSIEISTDYHLMWFFRTQTQSFQLCCSEESKPDRKQIRSYQHLSKREVVPFKW